jgi:Rieske Fe-S protein
MESTCTHAACPLGYDARAQVVACPCHSSQFRTAPDPNLPGSCAGDVVHLPAKQGPPAYQVEVAGSTVSILLYAVLGCKMLPRLTDGKVTLTIAGEPALGMPGGSVVGTPEGFSDPIAVVRVDTSTVVALNARCTHLGCTVAFDGEKLQCPCHESSFALDGRVQREPATRDLETYPVTFDGATIVVTLV